MPDNDSILATIAKFRADLIFDEFIGVFERVPAEIQKKLYDQYTEALKLAANKIGMPYEDAYAKVEDLATDMVQGLAYSQEDVKNRLAEYSIYV